MLIWCMRWYNRVNRVNKVNKMECGSADKKCINTFSWKHIVLITIAFFSFSS